MLDTSKDDRAKLVTRADQIQICFRPEHRPLTAGVALCPFSGADPLLRLIAVNGNPCPTRGNVSSAARANRLVTRADQIQLWWLPGLHLQSGWTSSSTCTSASVFEYIQVGSPRSKI